mmetsp:Transcript_14711/g.36536  ORF Transcript_14711/g.36536 Transcript_14711/m.36536 type:complete len:402 (-) Transcript_14711:960-2165(-)
MAVVQALAPVGKSVAHRIVAVPAVEEVGRPGAARSKVERAHLGAVARALKTPCLGTAGGETEVALLRQLVRAAEALPPDGTRGPCGAILPVVRLGATSTRANVRVDLGHACLGQLPVRIVLGKEEEAGLHAVGAQQDVREPQEEARRLESEAGVGELGHVVEVGRQLAHPAPLCIRLLRDDFLARLGRRTFPTAGQARCEGGKGDARERCHVVAHVGRDACRPLLQLLEPRLAFGGSVGWHVVHAHVAQLAATSDVVTEGPAAHDLLGGLQAAAPLGLEVALLVADFVVVRHERLEAVPRVGGTLALLHVGLRRARWHEAEMRLGEGPLQLRRAGDLGQQAVGQPREVGALPVHGEGIVRIAHDLHRLGYSARRAGAVRGHAAAEARQRVQLGARRNLIIG